MMYLPSTMIFMNTHQQLSTTWNWCVSRRQHNEQKSFILLTTKILLYANFGRNDAKHKDTEKDKQII